VYDRIIPVVGACFATDNRLDRDLPERFRAGSQVIDEVREYAAELDMLGVLPLPFPLEDLLSEQDRKHLYHIFGITGASYGNLSAREAVPEFGDATFWMTGRGVDKRNLKDIGRDIMLVKDFDEHTGTVFCSVFPDTTDIARVSVDAVEHYLIYREFPDVGAIVHIHAWIDGVLSTKQNYPCGTWELAREVVSLLRQAPDPSRCALGLKNHGLTITGTSLQEIFNRIRGRLQVSVPMFS
jgi:ribulose-5-phosphate 4-epimerase/fuculose-1-phosphate aldolase